MSSNGSVSKIGVYELHNLGDLQDLVVRALALGFTRESKATAGFNSVDVFELSDRIDSDLVDESS